MSKIKHLLGSATLFYLVSCALFFIIEPVYVYASDWAVANNLGAELVLGLALYAVSFYYCVVGVSSIIVLAVKIRKDKVKAIAPIIIVLLTCAIYLLLPGNDNRVWIRWFYTSALAVEDASTMAADYFNDEYQLQVSVANFGREQVSISEELYFVDVIDDINNQYRLYFDRRYKPLCDNKTVVAKIRQFDLDGFAERINQYGLSIDSCGTRAGYYHSEQRFKFVLGIETNTIPPPINSGDLYSILGELRDSGVDVLIFGLHTPEFLMPKPDLGHGIHDLQLGGVSFETNLSENEFYLLYTELSGQVYYNEEKLSGIISDFDYLGIRNPYFRIDASSETSTYYALWFYCESDNQDDIVIIKEHLQAIDDSYIRISDIRLGIVLEIISNGERQVIEVK